MTGKIYLVGESNELTTMQEVPYEAEALLQELLETYPDLLAGDQMRPKAPRRWLLISREVGVPDEESETSRWSLDHLFIDQEGIPTLVEVKRSSNTQIRREVVGQMLDYAANGTLYWSVDQIKQVFTTRCERDGLEPEDALSLFLETDSEWKEVDFWQAVKTNLQAGRVRLVFVADHIPTELRRIIEFLNEQMDPAEVVGVEIPQYVGGNRQALVPRVVGLTAGAEQKKTVGGSRNRRWDRESFFVELRKQRPAQDAQAAARLLDWAESRGLEIRWGTGSIYGSFSPKAKIGDDTAHLFSVYSDCNIQISFGAMNLAPFNESAWRRQLADRFEAIDSVRRFPDSRLNKYPVCGIGAVSTDEDVEAFIAVWEWYLEEIQRRAGSPS